MWCNIPVISRDKCFIAVGFLNYKTFIEKRLSMVRKMFVLTNVKHFHIVTDIQVYNLGSRVYGF